jgi:GT2 family glycosyltransferase
MPHMSRLRTTRHAAQRAIGRATVTVVVPCYNYARYLPAAVHSVLDQEQVEANVIVVDDASTDDSATVARELADADPRVTVMANHANQGAVATFNRGLAAADGEFLVRLDADDLLTPGSLARSVALLQRFPSVGLVYGHPLHFEGAELPAPRSEPTGWLTWSGPEWLEVRAAHATNVITSPEVVMRRSVVDRVGGQRDLAHTHDMEMWLRIAAHSDVGYVLGADQAWHRDHPLSLSTKADDPVVILGEIRDAFDVLFAGELPVNIPVARLHDDARRAVAQAALAQAQRTLDRGVVTDAARELRRFALEADPAIAETPAWRQQERAIGRAPGGAALGRIGGVAGRLRRRVSSRAAYRRWERTGVYEHLDVSAAKTGGQ